MVSRRRAGHIVVRRRLRASMSEDLRDWGIHLNGVTTTCRARGTTTGFAGDTETRSRFDSVMLPAFSREDVARMWRRDESSIGVRKATKTSPPCAKFAQHWVPGRTGGCSLPSLRVSSEAGGEFFSSLQPQAVGATPAKWITGWLIDSSERHRLCKGEVKTMGSACRAICGIHHGDPEARRGKVRILLPLPNECCAGLPQGAAQRLEDRSIPQVAAPCDKSAQRFSRKRKRKGTFCSVPLCLRGASAKTTIHGGYLSQSARQEWIWQLRDLLSGFVCLNRSFGVCGTT
jgi:hypothetical protein